MALGIYIYKKDSTTGEVFMDNSPKGVVRKLETGWEAQSWREMNHNEAPTVHKTRRLAVARLCEMKPGLWFGIGRLS